MPRRIRLAVFRWAAVGLATVGLGLLYAMVRARDIPRVQIGDIAQTMNFAYVRVEGEVSGEPRVFRTGGRTEGFRFTLDDGTGVLGVRLRGALVEDLERTDRLPRGGDRVDLAGSLQVTADGVTLWVQDVAALRVERRDVPVTRLSDVSVEDPSPVRIRARVVSVRAPPAGSRAPWEIVVEDETGPGVLVAFGSVLDEMAPEDRPVPDAWIEARVVPATYRGRVQLRLSSGMDLRRAEAPSVALSAVPEPVLPPAQDGRALSALAGVEEGAFVDLVAEVVQVRAPPAGSRAPWQVLLQDAGGITVPMVYWSEVADGLGEHAPRPGQRISVRARRDAFRGAVQLRLMRAEDLRPADDGAVP